MRKLLALICVISLSVGLLSACSPSTGGSGTGGTATNSGGTGDTDSTATGGTTADGTDSTATGDTATDNPADPIDVNITVLRGPTGIGAVQFMDEADNGNITSNNFNFTIAASVDEIVPGLAQKEIDIAAVPANLASVLYNNMDGAVQVLVIHTLGMIYIVENGDTIGSVEDLRGQRIIASGKGAPQEFALNYILTTNGIDPESDLEIEWKSEHTEVVQSLLAGTDKIALLPQPFVTTAQIADDNIRIALDLNDEWDKAQTTAVADSALIMGVMIARTEFVSENPTVVADFLDYYATSIAFANSNVEATAALVGQYELFPEAVALRAIPYCNITYIDGTDMRDKFSGFLGVLFEQNPQAIGGALPGEEFYYIR